MLRLLSLCPLWLVHAFGAAVGWASWLLSPRYRRAHTAHARQAGVAEGARRASIAQAGRAVLELPWLWLRPAQQPLGKRVQWRGSELVDAALAAGRGVVFLTPHMGSFEVTAQAYAERYGPAHGPITVLYRPARQPWLRQWMDASRARPGLATAPTSLQGVRQMLRALKQGQAVGLLPDQVPPQGMGLWTPFFGREAYTMTLAARLVQQSDAACLLVWGERLPRGQGYCVHVSAGPALSGLPLEAATQAVNAAVEATIRQNPAQYLWAYARYRAPRPS